MQVGFDLKTVVGQILKADAKIRATVKATEADSSKFVGACDADECPSCRCKREIRQDSMTVRHFDRRGELDNFTEADWLKNRTSYAGKDAHSLIPQSVMRRETQALVKEAIGAGTPCDLIEPGVWDKFVPEFQKRIWDKVNQPLRDDAVQERLEKLRDWMNPDDAIRDLKVKEKRAQPHVRRVIEADEWPLTPAQLAAHLPGVGTADNAVAEIKKGSIKVNGKVLAEGQAIPPEDLQQPLEFSLEGRTATLQLAPGAAKQIAERTSLSQEHQKVLKKFQSENPKIYDTIEIEKGPDGSLTLHKVKVNREAGTVQYHTRQADKAGNTTGYDERGFEITSDGLKLKFERDLLDQQRAVKENQYSDQIFSSIMGKPFTVSNQCAFCEELQADDTLWQRFDYYRKHSGTPRSYVGVEALKKLEALGPKQVFEDYIGDIVADLKARATADCQKLQEAQRRKEEEESKAKSKSEAATAAKGPDATEQEIRTAVDEAIKAGKATEGPNNKKMEVAKAKAAEMLEGKNYVAGPINKQIAEGLRSK